MAKKPYKKRKHTGKTKHGTMTLYKRPSITRVYTIVTKYRSTQKTQTGADQFFAFQFNLGGTYQESVINAYSTLFDQYRVNWMRIKIMPAYNVDLAAVTNISGGYHVLAIDQADGNTTNYAQLLSYRSAKECPVTKQLTMYTKPRYAVSAWSGAFGAYATGRGWVDSVTGGNILWYGFKYMLGGCPGTAYTIMLPEIEVSLSFRYSK
jgi:hypothetical protein